MKAKNRKQVLLAWFKFISILLATVATALVLLIGFVHTSKVELKKIEQQTMAFDRIFSLQIETTEKADSLVLLTQLLNTNERINDLHLQEVISDKKMGLMSHLDKMPQSDARLYRMLTQQFNGFLDTKDSIRYMLQEEQLIREDLLRCINNNKLAARRLSIGSATAGVENQTEKP